MSGFASLTPVMRFPLPAGNGPVDQSGSIWGRLKLVPEFSLLRACTQSGDAVRKIIEGADREVGDANGIALVVDHSDGDDAMPIDHACGGFRAGARPNLDIPAHYSLCAVSDSGTVAAGGVDANPAVRRDPNGGAA